MFSKFRFYLVVAVSLLVMAITACGKGGVDSSTIISDLSSQNMSVLEGDAGITELVFSIDFSEPLSVDITVDYSTEDLTAVAGEDYEATSGSLTVIAGSTSASIGVNIIGDTHYELDETFTLNLSSNASNIQLITASVVGTITNDDEKPVVTIGSASVVEGNSDTKNLTFFVNLDKAINTDINLDFSTVDGTAVGGEDFEVNSGSLTIAAGETTASIPISILGDSGVELHETFSIRLSNLSENATLGNDVAVGTITNDDIPTVNALNTSVLEGNEGNTQLTFTIASTDVVFADVTVAYTITAGSATAGIDFEIKSGNLVISTGESSVSVNVVVLGDYVLEPHETIHITLSNLSNNALAGNMVATGTIQNDDTLPMLNISDVSLLEGDSGSATMVFNAELSHPAGGDVSFNYLTQNISATAGSDYVEKNGSVLIPAGETAASIEINILGDVSLELDETFSVILNNISSHAVAGDLEALGTILSDDLPSLNVANASISEGNSGTSNLLFAVTLSEVALGDVVVTYETQATTASGGIDYSETTGSLNIPQGSLSGLISVPINGDTAGEADETFLLTLTAVTSNNAKFEDQQATGTILNDDIPTVSISSETIIEGDSGVKQMSFTLTLSDIAYGNATIEFSTTEDSATAGIDYTGRIGSVTFPAGSVSQTVIVDVIGDTAGEADEVFSITLSNPTSNISIGIGTGTGTIQNDDIPIVTITDISVTEGDVGVKQLEIVATMSDTVYQNVAVKTNTVDGTAKAGSDYVALVGSDGFGISPGTKSGSFTVDIINDTAGEPEEVFTINLSVLTDNATLENESITVTIADNDTPGLSISPASTLEGDTGTSHLQFEVNLSDVANGDVTVDYATANNSALSGEDYIAKSDTLVIPAGSNQGFISVSILGDGNDEPAESFVLTLSNISSNAVIDQASANGTILNDDQPILTLSDASIEEGDAGTTLLAFTVELDRPAYADANVQFSTLETTPVSAVQNVDYSTSNGTVTFPVGVVLQTFNVNIIGDQDQEVDEMFRVVLSNNSSNIILNDSEAMGTIINDDFAKLKVFVTSVSGTGNLSTWSDAGGQTGLAAGDAICGARAEAAGLTGNFVAWLSDDSDDAYCRVHNLTGKKSNNCGLSALPVTAGPWLRMDGFPFSETIDILTSFNSFNITPVLYDENNQKKYTSYFTGTSYNGIQRTENCDNWTIASGALGGFGRSTDTKSGWSYVAFNTCAINQSLFCIQTDQGEALPDYKIQGKKAFVTSEVGNGNLGSWQDAVNAGQSSGGIAAGDAICKARASAAGLTNSNSFKAWLSDSSINAKDRFTSDGPWVRVDGVKVANNLADLIDGEIFTSITLTENGNYRSGTRSFTGTNASGLNTTMNCSNWSSDQNISTVGVNSIVNELWTDTDTAWSCGSLNAIYCFEDE